MESQPCTTTTPTTLRRRAHTSWSTAAAAAADGHGNAVLVSPEHSLSLSRLRLPTASTNAAVGSDDAAAEDDDFHLSSCSSSSLGGSSSVSGSSDFHKDALLQLHHRSRPQPQPQLQLHAQQLQQPHLHRRHTYAGGPIAAAACTAETPRQQRQRQRRIAIEIPLAMKEVVIRHSRSRLVREDVINDTDGNGDIDDIDDESSTLSSLEVDLGHGRGIGGSSEQQDDPRCRYWTDRRREASNNTSSSSTNRVYSSTNALCGAEVDGNDVTNLNDAHVDDDEPSYMSYSLSTSTPCKSSMMRNHTNRRPPGHFKNQQSRDSSFLGGLGLLDIGVGAAAPMTTGDGTKSAAGTVYSAVGGRRSASPSHRSRDSLFRAVAQDQQSFRRAAPQSQPSSPIHDADEKKLLNQHPPKHSNRWSHRRHFSESCLLNTSIGADTDTTADSSHCLSHNNIHNNNIGPTVGPPPPPQSSLLLQFSGSNDGIFGHGSGTGAKRTHRRCASAGCGVHVAIS